MNFLPVIGVVRCPVTSTFQLLATCRASCPGYKGEDANYLACAGKVAVQKDDDQLLLPITLDEKVQL